ncbi:hypothetical protein [Parachlamydia sp. AcF125]|uniref:hypothetical protein n=1 Tax=Parachlamydia sp. AcF125 TaxID=2795736 RepID=UPI001BCA01C7|nr:hypothetical protein [Parachlamydia sp. AcF125]MBS4168474.1 hypothetical protein [Parachlamydia sp. AcF125]
MSRMIFLFAILAAAGVTYLLVDYAKDSYEVLPITKEVNPASAEISWLNFKSPSGKFEAKFPKQPQHATEKLVDPKTKELREYDMYAAEDSSGDVYMISLITFNEVDTPEEQAPLLTSIMNNMVNASTENVLKSMENGFFQHLQSLDFTIQNGEVEIQAKAFIVDRVLYVLTCVSKKLDHSPTKFDYFVNSFHLLNEKTL